MTGEFVIGIDLAAEPAKTALARIQWAPSGAVVRDLVVGIDDDTALSELTSVEKAGIDSPLGWPDSFTTFVTQHRAGSVANPGYAQDKHGRRQVLWRLTDEVVRVRTGLVPLSVAADRIAHVALRCAVLQARLAEAGRPVDRTGAGALVEVYPAGSLRAWGLPYRRYKGTAGAAALNTAVSKLLDKAPWLDLGEFEKRCRTRDDAFDAVIAALTARAAAMGSTLRPEPEQLDQARAEGWIAVPTSPLQLLEPHAIAHQLALSDE
ncbi:MAG TPA: DUF429 domain-containing protein [Actinocrinis sp.]|jgi:hypothetical protein